MAAKQTTSPQAQVERERRPKTEAAKPTPRRRIHSGDITYQRGTTADAPGPVNVHEDRQAAELRFASLVIALATTLRSENQWTWPELREVMADVSEAELRRAMDRCLRDGHAIAVSLDTFQAGRGRR